MTRTCETCGVTYDDAVAWTFCPHSRFLSEEQAARKEWAIRLLGKPVQWADGSGPVQIAAVTAEGFVEVVGFSGRFSPSFFKEA